MFARGAAYGNEPVPGRLRWTGEMKTEQGLCRLLGQDAIEKSRRRGIPKGLPWAGTRACPYIRFTFRWALRILRRFFSDGFS